jgi:hypothetical protein
MIPRFRRCHFSMFISVIAVFPENCISCQSHLPQTPRKSGENLTGRWNPGGVLGERPIGSDELEFLRREKNNRTERPHQTKLEADGDNCLSPYRISELTDERINICAGRPHRVAVLPQHILYQREEERIVCVY